VTLIMRLSGAAVFGTLADKYGRKLPLMLSVLWFSLFAFLSGFSTSYTMLFGLRALFGFGMGGEWAAGMRGDAPAAQHELDAARQLYAEIGATVQVERLAKEMDGHRRPVLLDELGAKS
jgi:Sugar (and other) transporter